jgi:hypothetical protein
VVLTTVAAPDFDGPEGGEEQGDLAAGATGHEGKSRSRTALDRFKRFDDGRFRQSLHPFPMKGRKGPIIVEHEEPAPGLLQTPEEVVEHD